MVTSLTALLPISATAQSKTATAKRTITGDAEVDFPVGSPNTAIAADPDGFDVPLDASAPEGTISGWDASDVRFSYDADADLMYVAINTLLPGGDADGDGDGGSTSPWLASLTGVDTADYGGGEAILVVLDVDQDGTADVILGTPNNQDINGYQVARYNSAVPLLFSRFGFAEPLTGNAGEVLNKPATFIPGAALNASDLIMTVSNWSTLPFSGTGDDAVRSFSYLMFQGSTADFGIGEEWAPGIGEFGAVTIPEESIALGSIGNTVWQDANEDGVFDEGAESGIPGVVVVLIDSEGNEIAQQITTEDGTYLFTDVPAGDYTVQVADSNFDDCGAPVYKSGKWAIGGGLEFDGSNVTFQPNVMAVSDSFSIAAQVKPTLGEWGTIVEKGTDPWPFALMVDPDGAINLGIDTGDGLEYVSSTGRLTGGAFEHVAVSYDGSNVSFYINGMLDSTAALSVPVADEVGDLYIGRNFVGCINDVRIYDEAISADAVATVATMECGALVDYYQTTVIGGTDDNTNKDLSFNYTLAEGEDFLGADFGFNETGSIGNTVWCEDDGDGYFEPQDGEKGISGVEVILKDDSGAVIATATTDADGQYLFEGLPSGTYTVEVPVTGANLECGDAITSIDNVSTGSPYQIIDGLTFGDRFYYDRIFTVRNISETLEDAQVLQTGNNDRDLTIDDHLTFTLGSDSKVFLAFSENCHVAAWLDPQGWELTEETFVIEKGDKTWNYLVFSKDYSAGQVTLDGPGPAQPMYGIFVQGNGCGPLLEKTPTTILDSASVDGANRSTPHTVNLGSGQDYIRADFGFTAPEAAACLGDTVFYDCDGDGKYEPNAGEYGIANVKVILVDSNHNIVDVQFTKADGTYLFGGLKPGRYLARVAGSNWQNNGPLMHRVTVVNRSARSADGHNRCAHFVTLEAGDCYQKADFGYLHACNYYQASSLMRYNYITCCWERRNKPHSKCWIVGD